MNKLRLVSIVCNAILALLGVFYLLFAYISKEYRLPHVPICPFYLITSIHCPLCGMTRSLGELLHGNIGMALTYHPLSVPLFVFWTCLTMIFSFYMARDIRQYFVKGRVNTKHDRYG